MFSLVVVFCLFYNSFPLLPIGVILPHLLPPPKKTYSPQPLTLENVFSYDHQWVASISGEHIRTVLATGDVIPARAANYQATVRYKDMLWPWRKTAEFLRQADVTLINLETPLFSDCKAEFSTTMIFCGSAKNIDGLLFAGVDVASLANNHIGNYGSARVEETKKILEDGGILVTGVDSPVFKNIRGIKFAFLGYNDIDSPLDFKKIAEEVTATKKNADVVIVEFHWGIEYQEQLSQRQKELGHLAIDSGADLIIGNHPHWIEPVEIYKGKLITYAHGNFIFDQEWSEKTKLGVVGKYTFYDNKLIDAEFFPVRIMDYGQPYFLEGKEKEKILEEMKTASEKLQD